MLPRAFFLTPFVLFALCPAIARADERDVFVHIRSPQIVRLERRAAPAGAWERACDSPCDAELPHDGEYRVVFTPTSAGEPFALTSAPHGEEELTIEVPSNGKKVAGKIVTGAGVLLAVGGVIGAVSFGVLSTHTQDCTKSDNDFCGAGPQIAGGLAVVSVVIAALGGALILGGLSLSSSGDWQVTQDINPKLDAFVRHPTWMGPVGSSRPATTLPWSISF